MGNGVGARVVGTGVGELVHVGHAVREQTHLLALVHALGPTRKPTDQYALPFRKTHASLGVAPLRPQSWFGLVEQKNGSAFTPCVPLFCENQSWHCCRVKAFPPPWQSPESDTTADTVAIKQKIGIIE